MNVRTAPRGHQGCFVAGGAAADDDDPGGHGPNLVGLIRS
jgi:hypothetical protein